MAWTSEWYNEQLRKQAERLKARGKASSPKPQQVVRNEPVAKAKREAGYTNRFHINVVSFRRRLIDPDNLCPKYFVDCIRYAGYIPDDNAKSITLQVSQIKVIGKENERTEIEITSVAQA